MNWVGRAVCLVLLGLCLGGQALALTWSQGPGYRSAEVRPEGSGRAGFTRMDPAATGLAFTNLLQGDLYLTNAVAHNGAGVAIGDVDGDGWADVYLCSLQGPNRLFRNRTGWKFEAIDAGDAACADHLSTGATFADVDGDGDLDLLVNGIAAGTRLFRNDGQGRFTEVKDAGLSRTASATSLTLADIDGDGDLDLYCPHFIDAMLLADPTTRFSIARRGDQWEVTKVNGESTRAPRWKGRFEALPDGRVRELPEVHGLYRNDGQGRFTAIESEPGVFLNEEGKPIPPFRDWGLAAMFRDLNGDGIPDLYVCNDNTSPDRIWINSGRGTFQLIDRLKFRHTSRSSMGIDFADLDRDGHDDLIVVDMLAREHRKRMTQLVRDRPNPADGERPEERPQFNRNTLFFGRADGSYVEAALMGGVAATDWTWTPLFLDVDLDGFEDLLVTNGFEFDVMDQDSQDVIKDPRRRFTDAQLKRSMQMRPRWRTRNLAFRNRGNGTFEPAGEAWGFDHEGVSYGMAQGDLDNDGDLDLVVNNLNEAAGVYRNEGAAGRIAVRLQGRPPNTQGISARVTLLGSVMSQAQEIICGGRYLSGDQATRTFATDPYGGSPLWLEVRWRDGRVTRVPWVLTNRIYEIQEPGPEVPREAVPEPPKPAPMFADVSDLIRHVHAEAPFDDWARQPMLFRRLSRLGPGVAWTDLDGDGWEDLVVSAGRGGRLAIHRNEQGQAFRRLEGGAPATTDQGAVVGWADGQGNRRLLVATSNYEGGAGTNSQVAMLSVGNLDRPEWLAAGPASLGPLCTGDVDGDGDLDLFVGGRFHPGRYPEAVSSSIWLNEAGRLALHPAWSEPFRSIGMVSGATFADLDDDGAVDLVLAMEWGPVRVFRNEKGRFVDRTKSLGLDGLTGWWTSVAAGDFDGDGRLDLACGNWGLNSLYELHPSSAIGLFHGDWMGDGSVRLIEAWRSGANWYPVHDRAFVARGLPEVAARFATHEAYGQATVRDLVGPAFEKAGFLEVAVRQSMILLNRGDRFEPLPLPREAQWAPAFSVHVGDVDGDGVEDLFLSQNFFGTLSDMSRDDGGNGLWLSGTGLGSFEALDAAVTGIRIPGEQRGAALVDFNHDGRVDLAVSQNNGPTRLYANRLGRRGLRVVLEGPPANPDGVGARMRVVYSGDRKGPCRVVQSGSGYWSQDAPAQILGLREAPVGLWVRWPGGREQVVPIPDQEWVVRVRYKP